MSDEERRVNRRLMKYWHEIKGNKVFPAEGDIDHVELADIWDSCFLVKVLDAVGKPSFRYYYLGESLIEAYDNDFTGADLYSQVQNSLGVKMREMMEDLVEKKSPINLESDFENTRNMVIKYRMCMLPIGENDNVEYILGGIRWRAF